MTTNQTIDGVPREQVERALDAIEQVGLQDKFIDYTFVRTVKHELRAMLDAPAQPPGEPVGYAIPGDMPAQSGYTKTVNPVSEGKYTFPLYAALPQGEPVAIVNSVISRKNRNFEIEVIDNQRLHIGTKLYVEQPAPVAVVQTCKIGIYGKAYDFPETNRAYTYADQPGNVEASKLGCAARSCSPGGDSIDHGLSLLKSLSDQGFGVFEIANLNTKE